MNLRHGRPSSLHSIQRLLVDIRSLDRIYLLFKLGDLGRRLLEILLMDLFPSEGRLGSCKTPNPLDMDLNHIQRWGRRRPKRTVLI